VQLQSSTQGGSSVISRRTAVQWQAARTIAVILDIGEAAIVRADVALSAVDASR